MGTPSDDWLIDQDKPEGDLFDPYGGTWSVPVFAERITELALLGLFVCFVFALIFA